MVTDVDAAKAFADATSERLIFVDDKTWFAANNNVYEPVSQARVVGLGIDFVNMASGQAKFEYQSKVVRSLKSSPRIKAMIDLAKPKLWAEASKFDHDHWLAGCHGGVLDLRERRLVTPKTIVTKRLGTTFDPDAVGPAIGGIVVAAAGAQAAFLLNALSYIGLIIVLLTWKRPAVPSPLPPENVGAAMAAGLRYVRLATT